MPVKLPAIKHFTTWRAERITFPTREPLELFVEYNEPRRLLLEKIYIQYPTIGGAAPTQFRQLKMNIVNQRTNRERFYEPIPISTFTTPGYYENFAPNATPMNQAYRGARSINMYFAPKTSVLIRITNFLGVGNPLTAILLIEGKFMLDKNEVFRC